MGRVIMGTVMVMMVGKAGRPAIAKASLHVFPILGARLVGLALQREIGLCRYLAVVVCQFDLGDPLDVPGARTDGRGRGATCERGRCRQGGNVS